MVRSILVASSVVMLDQPIFVIETLRKHSPALGTGRIAKEDFRFPNTDIVIEKGMQVLIPAAGRC